ncbi:hypothetical protein E2C01_014690 [Portunus trituberculatus]|uniref:Uncharacterized protein n=1 Tax=Portunus trituberculatus TaxID=210409 RepID=A0A5B7DKR9_PORTR|nr:hypothetical protein [Portunus trituberculatus]
MRAIKLIHNPPHHYHFKATTLPAGEDVTSAHLWNSGNCNGLTTGPVRECGCGSVSSASLVTLAE